MMIWCTLFWRLNLNDCVKQLIVFKIQEINATLKDEQDVSKLIGTINLTKTITNTVFL